MDEALEATEPPKETERGSPLVTLCRVVGLLTIATGVGLWLFASMEFLWVPAFLAVMGVLFLTVPAIALELLG